MAEWIDWDGDTIDIEPITEHLMAFNSSGSVHLNRDQVRQVITELEAWALTRPEPPPAGLFGSIGLPHIGAGLWIGMILIAVFVAGGMLLP